MTPIAVVHTDLPGNDFSSIFDAVDRDHVSYLRGHADVFPYAIGRSFYARLFPRGSVHLGWSSVTTHWLSKLPATLPHHVGPQTATPVEREPFALQAAEDWSEFLWNRAAELAPGGRMVMIEPCARPDGSMAKAGAPYLMDEIVNDLRTPDEYLLPLETGGVVHAYRAEVVQAPLNPMEDRFAATGDAHAFAQAMAGSTRAWGGHMLFGALPPEQHNVEDDFFARYVAKGEAAPERLQQDVFHVVMEFGPRH